VVDRGELALNPVSKVDTFDLENEPTRELSLTEEARLRAAIAELYPSKLPEFDLLFHTGARLSNWYGQHRKSRTPMEPLACSRSISIGRSLRFRARSRARVSGAA